MHIREKSSNFAPLFVETHVAHIGNDNRRRAISEFFINLKITIMTEQEIESKVKAIIVDKLCVEDSQVTDDANFQADLNADSLDTVELIMEFEKEFNITIPDEDTQKISTVGDAIAYVKEALA